MIKPKEKPCKGTGKGKGYGCKYLQLKRTYGLGHNCGCYRDWLLNSEEGKKKLERSTIKATETRRSLEKAEKERKEAEGIASALTLTKQVVHEMVRLRDKGKHCISCGCQWNSEFQAGHCYPTRYRSIRFHFYNINGQCVGCNIGKGGNEPQYLIELPKRIGQGNFNELKRLAGLDGQFNKHWTKEELKQIRIEANKIIKEL